MAFFDLDIERVVNSKRELGLELKGIACIQYPIYSVHCEIEDNSPDPLDGMDKSIAELIYGVTSDQQVISNLLGVPLSGIKSRIKHFKTYEYVDEKGERLSQYGYNTLILGEEKKIKKKSHDFLIDGLTLKPLSSIFYSRNYKQLLIEELSYYSYTNKDGQIITLNRFLPNIVHTAFDKEAIASYILDTDIDARKSLNIPTGIMSISKVSFAKLTFPLLVGMYDKKGTPRRELLDGLTPLGENTHVDAFSSQLNHRLSNLEFRLNIRKYEQNESGTHEFTTNWDEIDVENEEKRLYWISKEDLKTALENIYEISDIPIEDIIVEDTDIGINISKKVLNNCQERKELINNLRRGRDYEITMKFLRTGVWVTFFSFKTDDPFVLDLIEMIDFIESAKSNNIRLDQIISKLSSIDNYREKLIFLEEYELLEQIDIKLNMFQIEDVK